MEPDSREVADSGSSHAEETPYSQKERERKKERKKERNKKKERRKEAKKDKKSKKEKDKRILIINY